MSRKIIDVTGQDFAEVTAADGLTLFDLWSPTCAPCLTLAPILDDLATDFAGEVRICKVNAAADPALAERFAVRNLPTLVLSRGAVEVDRIVGTKSRAHLTTWIESHL